MASIDLRNSTAAAGRRFFAWWLGELSAVFAPAGSLSLAPFANALVLDWRGHELRLARRKGRRETPLAALPLEDPAEHQIEHVRGLFRRGGGRAIVLRFPAETGLRRTVPLPLSAERNLRQILVPRDGASHPLAGGGGLFLDRGRRAPSSEPRAHRTARGDPCRRRGTRDGAAAAMGLDADGARARRSRGRRRGCRSKALRQGPARARCRPPPWPPPRRRRHSTCPLLARLRHAPLLAPAPHRGARGATRRSTERSRACRGAASRVRAPERERPQPRQPPRRHSTAHRPPRGLERAPPRRELADRAPSRPHGRRALRLCPGRGCPHSAHRALALLLGREVRANLVRDAQLRMDRFQIGAALRAAKGAPP